MLKVVADLCGCFCCCVVCGHRCFSCPHFGDKILRKMSVRVCQQADKRALQGARFVDPAGLTAKQTRHFATFPSAAIFIRRTASRPCFSPNTNISLPHFCSIEKKSHMKRAVSLGRRRRLPALFGSFTCWSSPIVRQASSAAEQKSPYWFVSAPTPSLAERVKPQTSIEQHTASNTHKQENTGMGVADGTVILFILVASRYHPPHIPHTMLLL